MRIARARVVLRTLAEVTAGEVGRARGGGAVGEVDLGEGTVWTNAQVQRARAVRLALERMGPLYVKIGQMLSTRPDMVPDYMMAEFSNLHDRVSPRPFETFVPVLAEEMGPDWATNFRHVDTDPVGTASLAQVYKVVLKSGRDAVVKIQRPGIRQLVLDDMAMMQWVVRRIAKRAPDFNDIMDLEAMTDVVFSAMRPELDFTIEAEHMDDFRDRASDFDTLRIPEVLYAKPRVLVQSLAPGKSIREVDPASYTEKQRNAIGADLLAFQFWGFFVDRKFHADPHPGNIFISPDGEVNLIDWGMVDRVDRNLSTSMAVIMLSLSMNDGAAMARAWIDMGRATRRADIAGFINDMGRFVPGIAGQPLERFNFGVQLTAILKFSARRGIATSPAVASLGKSFANIEGSVRYLAPHLSITDIFEDEFKMITQELAREILNQESTVQGLSQTLLMMQKGPGQLRSLLADAANRDLTVRVGEEMGKRSRHDDRADKRAKRLRRAIVAAMLAGSWIDRRRFSGRDAS